jgi:hypothetical protein
MGVVANKKHAAAVRAATRVVLWNIFAPKAKRFLSSSLLGLGLKIQMCEILDS